MAASDPFGVRPFLWNYFAIRAVHTGDLCYNRPEFQ